MCQRLAQYTRNPKSDIRNPSSSTFLTHHLDQRIDVAEGVGERLVAAGVAFDSGHVVRHQHSVVADLLVHTDHLDEVDVAVVGERFLKVQESTLDVAEVDSENLVASSEVADHVGQLLVRIFQHFRNGALAKVQAVIFAGIDGDELFQAVDAAENANDSAKSFVEGHAGIVRMAGNPHLVFL